MELIKMLVIIKIFGAGIIRSLMGFMLSLLYE
jgi:hypothetical protein